MQKTTNLKLNKPDGTDIVDIAIINENMDILDSKLSSHTHTGATGQGPKITSSGLANNAVTDVIVGSRTINQDLASPANSGNLTQLFSWLAGRIKAVTGATNWHGAPAATLAQLWSLFGTSGHSHNGTAGQGPKISYTNLSGVPSTFKPSAHTHAPADLTSAVPVSKGGTGATSLTGILKGNGTGVVTQAVAGTDYIAGPVMIPSNADLNDYRTPGLYFSSSNNSVATFKNTPTSQAFALSVEKHAGVSQVLTEYPTATKPKLFHRNFYNSAWGAWREFSMDGHTHKSADITDATYDAKPNTVVRRDGSSVAKFHRCVNSGFDFELGSGDQTSRGNSGVSLALVKTGTSTGGSTLQINYNNCFSAGTYINSKLIVEHEIDAKKGVLAKSTATDIWGGWGRCVTIHGGTAGAIYHNESKLYLGFAAQNSAFYFGLKDGTQNYYGHINQNGWNGNVVGNATTASGLMGTGKIIDVDVFHDGVSKAGYYNEGTKNRPLGYAFGALLNVSGAKIKDSGHAQIAISHHNDVHVRGGWNGSFYPWLKMASVDAACGKVAPIMTPLVDWDKMAQIAKVTTVKNLNNANTGISAYGGDNKALGIGDIHLKQSYKKFDKILILFCNDPANEHNIVVWDKWELELHFAQKYRFNILRSSLWWSLWCANKANADHKLSTETIWYCQDQNCGIIEIYGLTY